MNNENTTRVFFVTDSNEDNEEIFETLEEAQSYLSATMKEPETARIRICLVKNAYQEDDGQWNYDDVSITFKTVITL